MSVDFSQFHPLDHWPGSAYCRSLPGGLRRHVAYTWEFRRRDQLVGPVRRVFCCPWGRHVVDVWWSRPFGQAGPVNVSPRCRFCSYTRLPSEAEVDEAHGWDREVRDGGGPA